MDIHHDAEQKQLSVLKSTTSKGLYLRAIQEIYPGINTGWLSSNLTFYNNWGQVRATATFKAFTTAKKMITDNNIVYHNRTSPSDDKSSDGSSDGSLMAVYRKTKESEMGMRKTRSSSQVYQPVMTCFWPSIVGMFQNVFAPLQSIMKVGKKMNSLETMLSGYTCSNWPFKADES
jgi:hypothetical protein